MIMSMMELDFIKCLFQCLLLSFGFCKLLFPPHVLPILSSKSLKLSLEFSCLCNCLIQLSLHILSIWFSLNCWDLRLSWLLLIKLVLIHCNFFNTWLFRILFIFIELLNFLFLIIVSFFSRLLLWEICLFTWLDFFLICLSILNFFLSLFLVWFKLGLGKHFLS